MKKAHMHLAPPPPAALVLPANVYPVVMNAVRSEALGLVGECPLCRKGARHAYYDTGEGGIGDYVIFVKVSPHCGKSKRAQGRLLALRIKK